MVHENIRVRLGRDDFATLSLFRFYPDGRYVVAGAHEDVVIWRAATGRCEQIATDGTWIGVRERPDAQMPNQENRLEKGDVMLLYTDGLTEARSETGEQFDIDRLADIVATHHAAPATAICTRILEATRTWAPVQDDDQTLVILRRL